MKLYHVTIHRTEEITFALQAENEDDAEARYLMDGDEIGSETVRTEVTSTEGVDS